MLRLIWWPSSSFVASLQLARSFFRLEVFLVSPYWSVSHCTGDLSLQGENFAALFTGKWNYQEKATWEVGITEAGRPGGGPTLGVNGWKSGRKDYFRGCEHWSCGRAAIPRGTLWAACWEDPHQRDPPSLCPPTHCSPPVASLDLLEAPQRGGPLNGLAHRLCWSLPV